MISRARHIVAAALSGALLMLPAFTGIANAASAGKVYPVPLAKTAADVKRVADHWKPDQLKKADIYSPATPGAAAAPASSAAGAAAGPAAPAATVKRTTAAVPSATPVLPRKGQVASTMGKVFFLLGGKEFWCSASAVTAKNRSVVATAGHCAYDPRQAKAAEFWIFVPNPGPNGETPEGIYVGSSISMHEDWAGRGDYDYDYAFVTVHRGFTWVAKNGTFVMQDVGRLQDNVGGLGLELNKKPDTYAVVAFGYPAGTQPDGSRPYDGRKLHMCLEGRTRWTVAPSLDLQKGVQLQRCDFSPGVSGGPWLIGYDKDRRLGSLAGVNSLTWNRDAKDRYDAVSSPYFDNATGDVYRRAAAQTTPANVT
ncbi:trypsin-like serine peptidase [Nonomuraea basaltis]|uniref:trypsin-like serine peptidase n=1 Tax=Nonomuraea basaltis TaxID=2495887 RepID=UPI00110C7175|nr:trypsin-like serine protease [Nonomuraea basaltis]TMR94583.1 trypsin-like serine protease [Nonomuraea basaltis]